ncbi:MAG TPA: pilus assembly protein TadG-related protein, partial [Dehalococcoidia bacterium]
MLRFPRRLSEEHGQSLLLLVLAITVMFVIGAIVVDVGLWLSERRGSQTQADFSALAGAYELLNPAASSSDAVT